MDTAPISAELFSQMLEQFLADAPRAIVVEEGEVLFDFPAARYSISGDGKCVLHLWSEERNVVRRVLDAQVKGRTLRLEVLRFGQAKPLHMEISADRDHCTGTVKGALRANYQHLLGRVLERDHPGFKIENLSGSPDLEHSFSPVYTRAILRAGQSAFAVLGVNAEETQSSVDAALTFGILWMDYQRQALAGRAHVEGLKLFLPPGRSEIVRLRMSHLNAEAAKWQIFELDERSEICEPLDTSDWGNIVTRLTRAVDVETARQRFAASIDRTGAGAGSRDHRRVGVGGRVPSLRAGVRARPAYPGSGIVWPCGVHPLRYRASGV